MCGAKTHTANGWATASIRGGRQPHALHRREMRPPLQPVVFKRAIRSRIAHPPFD